MRAWAIAIAFLALTGCPKPLEPVQNDSATADAAGPQRGVDRSHRGRLAPNVAFVAPDGGEIRLADLRGPVLVNLWATWCAPCVKELPTLNRLARSHDDDGALSVVAVSQDMGPQQSVAAFLDHLEVQDLGAYHDPKMALSGALGPDAVLPTTILYDARGREVWRYVGDLDWTGPEAARLLAETPGGTG